jgi:hypothetical protein
MIAEKIWDQKSDLWSVACVLLELYSGKLLFDTSDTYEHLLLIQKVSGEVPKDMVLRSSVRKWFSKNNHLLVVENCPLKVLSRVKAQRTIKDIVSPKHGALADLIAQLLVPFVLDDRTNATAQFQGSP